jgi:protein-L-isoaspartate(D-aspartate) O-methyltransferase
LRTPLVSFVVECSFFRDACALRAVQLLFEAGWNRRPPTSDERHKIVSLKPSSPISSDLDLAGRRQHMVETQLRQRGIRDELVLAAMARVPRHEFVSESYRDRAYDDSPLPIGYGQTISQPYMVALMLENLALAPNHTVLEIGTGSGYQTALLAELAAHVDSMDRQPGLTAAAKAILQRLGYTNLTIRTGDGSLGMPDRAPFDAIIVSAAAPQLPPALFDQLREGGRLVVPVGSVDTQLLQVVAKQQGTPVIQFQIGCRFVPLIGDQGYPRE